VARASQDVTFLNAASPVHPTLRAGAAPRIGRFAGHAGAQCLQAVAARRSASTLRWEHRWRRRPGYSFAS
jgi:hypothetical protein